MNKKQRTAVFEHWRGAILRETRDLGSLEQMAARALSDPDVSGDDELVSEIRAEVEERRLELGRRDEVPEPPTRLPEAIPATARSALIPERKASPEEIRSAFERLAHNLRELVERDDAREAESVLGRMRTIQAENPALIRVDELPDYEEQLTIIGRRRVEIEQRIAALATQVIDAAGRGDEPTLTLVMHRLSETHAAHPRFFGEARLDEIRCQVAKASEKYEHQLAARKLIEREQSVAAEIRRLTAAVREFHRMTRTVPHNTEEYRRAETEYRRVVRDVNAHDKEWVAGFILELMDLLAEWGDPPPDAEAQVDRFVEGIRAGLDRARTEVRTMAAGN